MSTKQKKIPFRFLAGILLLSTLLVTSLSISLVSAHGIGTAHPRTWHAVVGVETKDHAIQGMAFLPGELWIDVGDTVVWTVKGGDIHTVTFLKPGQSLPPFNPNDPTQTLPQGSSTYDGVSYYNSGLMSDVPSQQVGLTVFRTYTLTFGVTGDFTYHCIVHPSMTAIIHIRPAGTPYPFSQLAYDLQIAQGTANILANGARFAAQAISESNNHNVTVGIGDGLADVMRFFPQHIVIHVNDTITFTNRDSMEPHTVSFGTFPPNFDNFFPLGNPAAFDGSEPLNSGFIGASFPSGPTYKVTFVKAGTYAFRCDLHDFLGMLATIVVLP